MFKNEKCTCTACKTIVFHHQICKFVTFLLPSSRDEWIVHENIYSFLFAVILVGHLIRGKNILEYNISKKSPVILTMVVN